MEQGKINKGFWNRYAKLYDFEISRFNRAAYAEMYRLMAAALSKDMRVLENIKRVLKPNGLLIAPTFPLVYLEARRL